MKKTKISLAILALAASTILAACGGTTSSTTPATSQPGTSVTPGNSSITSAVVVDHEELKVTKPTKSTYELGEALDLDGLKVEKVSYDADDVELERVTLSEGEYTLSHPGTTVASGLTLDFAGEMPITVKAGELTASFTITINPSVTAALRITKPTKSEYVVGDELDLTGLKVEKVTTTDTGSSKVEPTEEVVELKAGEYTLSHPGTTIENGLVLDFAGAMPITVTAGDLKVKFTITINPKVTEELKVTPPTKTTYVHGEALDLSGLKVEKVTTTDNGGKAEPTVVTKELTEAEYTLTHGGRFTVTDGVLLEESGLMNIKVTAGDLTATFTITIDSVVTKAIAVTNLPTKTEYKAGEIFETAGLVVSLTTTTDGEAVTTALEEGDYTLTIDGQAAATYIFQPTEENQEYTVTVTPKDTTIAPVTFKVTASPVEVAKYGVTIEGLGDMKLDWWYVGGTEWVVDRGEPIEDITTAKFVEGDRIGFSIAADSPSYVKYEDMELEGASLSRTTIGDDEKESFYFTVKTSDVKLIVNNLRSETKYAGKEFVGTYTVYDLSSGTTAHTLVVGADGEVTLDDGTSYEYTYDEATGDFDMEYSSVSLAYSAGAVFYNNKYLGFKDSTISNYLFNSSNDYIAEFSADGGTKLVYKYYSTLLVEGADFTAEYVGEDLSDFSVLTLTADVNDEGDSCFSIAMGYSSVDRTAVEGKHLLYIVSNGKGGFTREKKDGTQGTYTGAEGELVLDGFKNYTLNGVGGTCTYDESLGIITLDTGKTYKIDTDAMTYEEFELVTSDPWATSTAEFVSEDGTFTFTFSNGKVTFTDSKHSWDDEGTAISYKVSNGKLTFEATYDWYNDEYAEFVLFIDSSLETITVFEDVVAEPLYGWGGTTIMKAGTVFTLVTE